MTTSDDPPGIEEAPVRAAGTRDDELLHLLLEATTDGVMDWDLGQGTIRYTDRWKLLLGYESAALGNALSLWSDLSHPDDLPRVRELLQDHLENCWPFGHTWRMRHHNGEWRWIFCRAVTTRDGDGHPARLVAVFSDVTDRVRAEERHRALASAIPDLMLRIDGAGLIVDVKAPEANPALDLIIWPVAGQLLSTWGPAQEWHERVTSCIRLGPGGAGNRAFEVALVGAALRRSAEVRVVPSGENEAVCIVRDVTEQRQLQAQLLQSQKLESVGQLAAGIAHEINTPMQYIGDSLNFVKDGCAAMLAVIAGYEETLATAPPDAIAREALEQLAQLKDDQDLSYVGEQLPRAISSALEGVSRVARIVRAMKEFSHPGSAEKTPSDLNREIETTITIATHVWRGVADLERQLDPELPRVPCHPGEINQVILNLIVNAAHAIGDVVKQSASKGTITISTRAVDGCAEIRVADTGGGIPEKIRDRIFEPFFTTKEVGRGTGQGLAIARTTVVDKHGGTIDFETELGKGTCFVVRLPLGAAAGAPALG